MTSYLWLALRKSDKTEGRKEGQGGQSDKGKKGEKKERIDWGKMVDLGK